MPALTEKTQQPEKIDRNVHLIGVVSQWIAQQEEGVQPDENGKNNLILARRLKNYLRSPSWVNENYLVEAFKNCERLVDDVLSGVMDECEQTSQSLKIKSDLERKLVNYTQQETTPSFWGQSRSVYRAKRLVAHGLKCYLRDELSLVDFNKIVRENKEKYNQGWSSEIDSIIVRVKQLKREQLYAISRISRIRSEGDENLIEAIGQFAKGEISQVDLIGVYEINKQNDVSRHVIYLYDRSLEIDENISARVDESFGLGVKW